MASLHQWQAFLHEEIDDQEQVKLLLEYASVLLSNDVPIIFEFNHLACLFGVQPFNLARIVFDTTSSYRVFTIPKRSGGERCIVSPYPSLAICQKWIQENILKKIYVSDCAYAYVNGKSIIDNATIHVESDELLKLDIVDYFGSINENEVTTVFKNQGYTRLVSKYLASLCCYKEALPQGACTSPILSNIIAVSLDKRLVALAKKLGLKYTRYADDMAFSGKKIPRNLAKYVATIIEDEGFQINKKKTVLKTKGQKKIITGICITGSKIRVSKAYRRKFRQDIHFLSINGIAEFNGSRQLYDPVYLDRMIGKAHFILAVEPKNKDALSALVTLKDMKIQLGI